MINRSRPERSTDGDGVIEFFKLKKTEFGSNSKSLVAELDGLGDSTDEDEVERVSGAEVLSPVGFTARPNISAETEGVIIRDGDDVVVAFIIDKSVAQPIIEPGEVVIWSPSKPTECNIILNKDGAIRIVTSSGQDVRINSGTSPVAHEGSLTAGHSHVLSGTAGPWAIAGTAVTTTDAIATGAGSPHLKVPT